MSELTKRIITASVLLAFAIVWMFFLSDSWFDRVACLLGLIVSVELLLMVGPRKVSLYLLTALFSWVVLLLSWLLLPDAVGVLAAILFSMIIWTLLFFLNSEASSKGELLTGDFRKLVYIQWMMTLLLIFVWSLMLAHRQPDGVWFLAGAMAGVWGADIAAYFTGRALGVKKLCPAVSPGKTVEGFCGGVLFGMLVASLIWVFLLDMAVVHAALLSLVLVLIAVGGDLAESALKRAVGVKDSGRILPGHGGILDRVDALIPSIPVVVIIWMTLNSTWIIKEALVNS